MEDKILHLFQNSQKWSDMEMLSGEMALVPMFKYWV